jgi:branched-chain amino acid transport system permease protein
MKMRFMKIDREGATLLVMLFVLLLLPTYFHGNPYIMHTLITCLIWSVVAAAWDFMMGYAGIFTFGQFAFFTIGAYASGMLTLYAGVPPPLGVLLAGLIAAGVGVIVGLPCLRLKGAYIALVTFALHMILVPLINSDLGRAIGTGGTKGLLDIPTLVAGLSVAAKVPWYYTLLGVAFLSFFIIYRITKSSIGLAFVALRDSEPFAKILGVDEFRHKLMVFGISAFLTGMIGAFYAHYTGIVSTRILGLDIFLLVMVMLVIGGMGKFPGAAIGAFIVTFLNEALRLAGEYRLFIFGAIVVSVIVLVPDGIMGALLPTGRVGPAERLGRFIRQVVTNRFGKNNIDKQRPAGKNL